ncbi:MAG: T9SS type A sorting domain-containing protein [Muribaculaceae bacterium]|nr:T9SS type A sorting domain-containing protein [Muribaculaceae bacterium]
MLKRIFTSLLTLIAGVSASAQYYGQPLFVEGFDADEFPSQWRQENKADGNQTEWTLSDVDRPKFSDIEPTSMRSAKIMVRGNDTKLTLTSPEIDATGQTSIQTGFYGNELNYTFRGGIDFRFRASHDGGESWTDLFSSLEGSSFTGQQVGNWNLYKYTLPEEFNNQKILLQFYIDATMVEAPQALAGYVDGVFVSVLPECDPEITDINYSTNERRPTSQILSSSEPLRLQVMNSGKGELTEAEFYYTINDRAEVSEYHIFQNPLKPGETFLFEFSNGIDLGQPNSNFIIKSGVRVDGDFNTDNNSITAYAENILVSVPYIPPFITEEDGVTATSTAGWTTFENNYEFGWDYDDWDTFYWYVETEWNDDPNDAYLVSRPIQLYKDDSYRLQFSAFSEDEGDGANIMKVYVSPDQEMESNLILVWENDDITEDNALEQSAIFSVPEDGVYYIGFNSLSEPEAAIMRLQDIALYRNVNNDMAVVAVNSPVKSSYTYTDNEIVTATVVNYGASTVKGGSVKINLSVDGKDMLSELISQDIPVNKKFDYTFSKSIDLSDLGTRHTLRVWVEYTGDEDESNDAIEFDTESDVTLVPYIPDMGSSTSKGGDVTRWEAADDNGDGYTFTARGDSELDSYAFSYGGGLYGLSTVTLPSSNDNLLSRHIKLEGNKGYKLAYFTRIGTEGGSLPLNIKLINTADNSETEISSLNVDNLYYKENIVVFTAPSDGIYRLQFSVVDNKPIDYRIYLGKFRLMEQFANDLSLEEIIIPSSYISEIKSYPVGALVRNNGTAPVTGFRLEASSESIGIKTMELNNVTLEPDASYVVYFKDDFVFNGTEDEELKIDVLTKGDEFTANNVNTITLRYIPPYSMPFNLLPEEALKRMAAFNLNRDGSMFNIDRTMGVGFTYLSDGETVANDYVATPAIKLSSETPKRISFSYYVLEGDVTDFDVFAYDAKNDIRVDIATINKASQTAMSRYIGFFSVPSDGDYSICFQPKGKASSLFINAAVSVEEADELPDLKITKALTHVAPAVLDINERVEVEFIGKAEQGVQCVPFELEINGKVYHSIFTRYTSLCAEGESYSVAFDGVNLSEPGEYRAICRAIVPFDLTPEDNELTFSINSLPVVDVALTNLVSPISGKLGHQEKIAVEIANNGKGSISGIDITCKVSNSNATTTLTEKIFDVIKSGEKITYNFDETIDLFEEDVYSFIIEAVVENDVNLENNRLQANINSTHKDFDAGVVELVAPSDAAFGTKETITVRVKNYGETDLFDVPVIAAVSYGFEESVQEINGILAQLPEGEECDFTFPTTVDLSRCGEYTIIVLTNVNGDADSSNDMLTTTLRCLTQDVGVSRIISPVTGEDLGLCDVVVEVTNYGEADVTDIPMEYQIGNMPQLATMEGELKAGETREFKFPVPYEFTSYRKTTLRARTNLENDANLENDEIRVDIENLSGVSDLKVEIGLWPNPAHDILSVATQSGITEIEIFDLNGKLTAKYNGNGENKMELKLNLIPGHYLLRAILNDGSVSIARLIVI